MNSISFFISEILDEDIFEEVLILAEALDETGYPKIEDYFYRVVPAYPCYDMLVKIFCKKKKNKTLQYYVKCDIIETVLNRR